MKAYEDYRDLPPDVGGLHLRRKMAYRARDLRPDRLTVAYQICLECAAQIIWWRVRGGPRAAIYHSPDDEGEVDSSG